MRVVPGSLPVMEQMCEECEGRVTFVMRYFPILSHKNAKLAARAVEADPRAETQLGLRGDSLRSLQISFHCRA